MNIHYRAPIRYEYKDAIPDEELAQRQAEHMRRLYQEEKRRKYIQELQDMNNRRHTDNFTPSQKSPIALNRYDNTFGSELSSISPKSPHHQQQQSRITAKALYNFQGQTARYVFIIVCQCQNIIDFHAIISISIQTSPF